jgi:hypothetical protein
VSHREKPVAHFALPKRIHVCRYGEVVYQATFVPPVAVGGSAKPAEIRIPWWGSAR